MAQESTQPFGGRGAAAPSLMGASLATLYFAGGTVGALSVILPHPAGANEQMLWSNIALAYVAAIAIAMLRNRLPAWSYQLAILAGTLVITRAIHYSGETSGFYTFWYLWAGLYAFLFFGRAWGFAHTAAIGLAYAWLLSRGPGDEAIAQWLLTVATIAIAGVLVDFLSQRLREEISGSEMRARNVAAIGAVAHELSRRVETAEVEPAICEALVTVTGASAAAVWRPASDGRGLLASASIGSELTGEIVPFLTPRAGAVRAFTMGEPQFSVDGEGRPEDEPDGRRTGARSCLWQPVVRDGMPVAVLGIYWKDRVAAPSPEVLELAKLLASEASIALERAELVDRLERAALTDELTGLPNRRGWEEALAREISRAGRTGEPLCVAMIDLDGFKSYNDAYGHRSGDRLLKEAASNWRELLRASDVLARPGGDEFALALAGCSAADAAAQIERLRAAMPGHETCSAGVAAWDGAESPEALVNRADQELYRAKRGGRDQISAAV